MSSSEEHEEQAQPGPSGAKVKNPLFQQKKKQQPEPEESSSEITDQSDTSSEFDDFDDDEDDISSEGDPPNGKQDEEEDDEDPLIKRLKLAKEKKERNAPPDIKLRDPIVDISFHPLKPLIATGSITGDIKLFEVSNDVNKLRKHFKIHKKDVRSIEFDNDGSHFYSGSEDKSLRIIDMESFQVKHKILNAHSSALYKVRPIDERICASGDEDGTVKLWDYRQAKAVMEHKPFDDFVSDFLIDEECKLMIASSGEGTLHTYNLRGRRPDIQSEVYEGELNCLGLVHRGSKLVAGCGDGRLYMFNWNEFAYHSADFPGHPDAINDLVAVTDNIVITACEDGTIRAVHLYPHRFLGAVGHHESGFGIEHLDISSEGDIIASISHDNKVKFWNIKYFEEEVNLEKKMPKPFNNRVKHKVRRKENKIKMAKEKEFQLPSSNRTNKKDFFKELE